MAMERPTRLDGQGYVSETLVRAVEVNVGQDVGGRVFAVTHEAADRYRPAPRATSARRRPRARVSL